MSNRRRRMCRNCGELFRPDPRNLRHQRYCAEPACRRASKAASQQRLGRAPSRSCSHKGAFSLSMKRMDVDKDDLKAIQEGRYPDI
jgi:hypothetical protein